MITLRWGKIHALDVFEDSQEVARALVVQAAAGLDEAAAQPILSAEAESAKHAAKKRIAMHRLRDAGRRWRHGVNAWARSASVRANTRLDSASVTGVNGVRWDGARRVMRELRQSPGEALIPPSYRFDNGRLDEAIRGKSCHLPNGGCERSRSARLVAPTCGEWTASLWVAG